MSSGAKVGAGKLGRGDGAFDLASYAPVAERITLFYETFPRGRIITELVSRTERDVVFRVMRVTRHELQDGFVLSMLGDIERSALRAH